MKKEDDVGTKKITIEQFSITSTKPFAEVVSAIAAQVGHHFNTKQWGEPQPHMANVTNFSRRTCYGARLLGNSCWSAGWRRLLFLSRRTIALYRKLGALLKFQVYPSAGQSRGDTNTGANRSTNCRPLSSGNNATNESSYESPGRGSLNTRLHSF